MDNPKQHDNDGLVVLPAAPGQPVEPDTVVFTRAEWEADDESEAFGVRKIVPKAKEKTPGVKAVLVFHESFLRAKRRMKECTFIRPVIDLPEIISAMIDVCDADPVVMEKVGKKMLERRAQQLAELQSGVKFAPSSERQSG